METEASVLALTELMVLWTVGEDTPALSVLCEVCKVQTFTRLSSNPEEEVGDSPKSGREEASGKEEKGALGLCESECSQQTCYRCSLSAPPRSTESESLGWVPILCVFIASRSS